MKTLLLFLLSALTVLGQSVELRSVTILGGVEIGQAAAPAGDQSYLILSETTANDNNSLFNNPGRLWMSNMYTNTAGSNFTLTRFEAYLYKTGSPTQTIQAHVYTDNLSKVPLTSRAISSNVVSCAGWPAGTNWYTFVFTNTIVITNGTTNHIVLQADSTNDANYPRWAINYSVGGAKMCNSADGTIWTSSGGNFSACYKIYGY